MGDIGGTLLADEANPNQWPELIDTLWAMFGLNDVNFSECAFKILKNLVGYEPAAF